MKFNFKKITSVLASAVMLSSTIGFAAAVSYPEPFVSGGTADSAIVVGSSAAASDYAAAIDLQENLQGLVTTTSTSTSATATGGDSYKIERSSTKFQLGKGVLDVVSGTITDSDMPNLLVDGTFLDSDNNEKDYTQKIVLANFSVGMFDDNDYKEDSPTVGVRIASGSPVLNYTLTFTDQPTWTKLETASINLLGKNYYILDVNTPTNTSMTLLDSAESATLAEDESTTVSGKEVSVTFIGSNQVKLRVDGEETNTLSESETYKLSDGSYVGIKDIMYTSKTGAVSKVEFSIGSGKLKLTDSSDVELNDDTIPRLKAYLGGNGGASLTSITIEWKADGDLFIAPDNEPEMPGFKAVKLSWGGMTYPKEEEISVEAGSDDYIVLKDFPLKDSTETIAILYGNSTTYTLVGKDSTNILRTAGAGNITFDTDTDEYFVATYDDGTNAESYLMRATGFKTENSGATNKTTIQYKSSGTWTSAQTDVQAGDEVTLGSVTLTVGTINYDGKSVVLAPGTNNVNFRTLYSKEGMKVYLPWINETTITRTTTVNCTDTSDMDTTLDSAIGQVGYNYTISNATASTYCAYYNTTFGLIFSEEDKNENKAAGSNVTVTLGWNSATTPQAHVGDIIGESVSFAEQGSTDIYESHIYSPLATKLLWDKSGDQYKLTLIYHGGESYADVFVAAPETTITPGTTTSGGGGQIIIVEDNQVDSVSDKNLIVVGGSCINTVAAKILGSDTPLCTDAFTEKTGVGPGQYIIKTIASPYAAADSGKVAMLVAGYEAAETKLAVAKVLEGVTSDVDTEQIYPETTVSA